MATLKIALTETVSQVLQASEILLVGIVIVGTLAFSAIHMFY